MKEVVGIVFDDYDVLERAAVRAGSTDSWGADRIQHRLDTLPVSVVRLPSVVMFVNKNSMQLLGATYTTGGILADGNGIKDVRAEI